MAKGSFKHFHGNAVTFGCVLRAREFKAVGQTIGIIADNRDFAGVFGKQIPSKQISGFCVSKVYAAVLIHRIEVLKTEHKRVNAARVKRLYRVHRPFERRAY